VLDYVGPTLQPAEGLAQTFEVGARTPLTQGPDGWPVGELVHTLPGVLTNVTVIQCRGESYVRTDRRPLPPRVWRPRNGLGQDAWAPSDPLTFDGPVDNYRELVVPLPIYRPERKLTAEGYLGDLLAQEKAAAAALAGTLTYDESVIARRFALMSFGAGHRRPER